MSVEPQSLHLKDRIDSIHRRISEAASRSGRDSSAVRLVAATKTVAPATIIDAARLGVREIGENRVQEAEAKRRELTNGPALTRHFIGQLQTNKAAKAVELFDVVQSVDRMKLAEAISRAATQAGKRQRVLIEVKISDDVAKGGVLPQDAPPFIAAVGEMPGLELIGLMGIGPWGAGEIATRRSFRRLSDLFRENSHAFGQAPVLSMGMSEDFEIAIEEGSTMVRIGRALFGERNAN